MSDAITVNMPMKFKPWQVPNFALLDLPPRPRQEGLLVGAGQVPLGELSEEALAALAEAWVAELYRKAGKRRPPEIRAA